MRLSSLRNVWQDLSLESEYGVNLERANGSSLSLLHIQSSLNSAPFQGACQPWDTGTLEPTSVLDLGSPSPSSRAVSSISGSHEDRPTVSSPSLLDESEKKVKVGNHGHSYRGRGHWMVENAVEREFGDHKGAVQSSKIMDWSTNHSQKKYASGHEQINRGDIFLPMERTEESSFFGNKDIETFHKASAPARMTHSLVFPPVRQSEINGESGSILEENRHNSFLKILTGAKYSSIDSPGDNHKFLSGEGFESAASAQGCNISVSGSACAGKNNVEWQCEETKSRDLDDLIADFQGYSEVPLHGNLGEALHCGIVNMDSMVYSSPVPESLMKWLLWESGEVQSIEESSNGEEPGIGLGSKPPSKLHDKTTESSSQLQFPSLATMKACCSMSNQMTDDMKVERSLQSSFSSLEYARAPPAFVQLPAFPKLTESSLDPHHASETLLPSDSYLPSSSLSSFQGMNIEMWGTFCPIHKSEEELKPRVKSLSHSGVQTLVSHNQSMSFSPDNCVHLSDPSFTQQNYASQSTLLDGSLDQSAPLISNLQRHHPFHLQSQSSNPASEPPLEFYIFNSCQQISPNMLQQLVSGQPEFTGFHQYAGRKSQQCQHSGASTPIGLELQPYHYLGTNRDGGATRQAVAQMGQTREEILPEARQKNIHAGASQLSCIGFSSHDRSELQAQQIHNAAQGPNENADEGLALVNLLFQLVEALDTGDPDATHLILARLNQYSLPQNKYIQRVVLYFRDTLAAKLMSVPKCSRYIFSPLEFLQKLTAHYAFCEASPFLSFAHFVANQAILEAFEGEESVHVIDFEINFGCQWASFLQDFALKPGNARKLRITAVGFQRDEMYFAGENLCSFAKDHNVLLDFQMVVTKPESLTSEMLPVRDNEPVAANFVLSRHTMLGESPNSIDTILQVVKGLSPKIVTVVEKELDDNCPYLKTRFLEALSYYSYLSDLLSTSHLDNETVMFIEKLLFMPEIFDIVICERLTRGEQYTGLQRWRQRFLSAGFSNIPLSNLAEANAQCLIRRSSAFQGYEILKNEGGIFLGWHGKTLLAASAWTC